jgi:choline dehydrogenase-like flavoprotein
VSRQLNVSCDVVVIGAGVAGSWAAKELSEAGLSVTLLEAGPEVPPRDHMRAVGWTEEQRRSHAQRQRVQCRHPAYWMLNPAHFVDDLQHPYISESEEPYMWIRGRQVGGRSLTWGGVSLRLSPYELERHEDGCDAPWPLSYEELAPFYTHVEQFLGIQGGREALPQLPCGPLNEPPPLTKAEVHFRNTVQARWPERAVIQSRGVPIDSAGQEADYPAVSTQRRVLPAAIRTGRVDLRSNCVVSRLTLNEDGRQITEVKGVDRLTHQPFEVRGRVVVLCASTIESIRLLLHSRCPAAPDGIGNSSGCLGRYLLDHAATALVGRIPGEVLREVLPVGSANGIVIPRFRFSDSNFKGGYGLWGSMGRVRAPDSMEPFWMLTAMVEALPQASNRIRLDEGRADEWGMPLPRIQYAYSENEMRMRADAERCMREMIDSVGWVIDQELRMQPGQFVHELGGARMGRDPRRSVLNAYNQCWDVPNLFVLDGSCFVTAGWQNPTHTITSIAVRASRFIAEKIRRHEFQ